MTAQGKDIVPLVGARRRDHLAEALGARDVELTPAHLAALAKAFPPGAAAGGRYPEEQLEHMDSEKPAAKAASWGDGNQRCPLKSVMTGASPLSGSAGSRA